MAAVDAGSPDPRAPAMVTLWDLVWPILAVAGVVVVLSVGGGLLAAVAFHHDKTAVQAFLAGVRANFWFLQGVALAIYVLLFAILWLVLRRKGEGALVGRFAPVPAGTLLTGASSGVAFAILFLIAIGALASTHLVAFHPTATEQALTPHRVPQLVLALVGLSVFAPLTEEMYFRGLLLSWLNGKLGRTAAIAISAALFGLFHFRFRSHVGPEGWVLTATLILFGAMNALWVFRTRSLWPSVAAHGAYNGMLLLLPLLAKH